jgi:MFS family permease
MRRISVKGVLVGGILDIIATFVTSIPLLVVASLQLKVAHLPTPERTAALMKAIGPGSSYYLLGLALGSACSVLGGYVAARIAKREERLNGALSSWLCMLSGLYSWWTGAYAATAMAHVGYLILSPVMGALGGYLRESTKPTPPADETSPARAA